MSLMKGSCALLPAALAITSFHPLKAGVDLSSPARNSGPFTTSAGSLFFTCSSVLIRLPLALLCLLFWLFSPERFLL